MSSEKSIEITGDSVEDAIEEGLVQLGVGPAEVIVEVLEEPSKGVFGFGSRQARVRLQRLVTSAPPTPTAPPAPAKVSAATATDEHGTVESVAAALDESAAAEDARVGKEVLSELLTKMSIEAEVVIRRVESGRPDEEAPWLLDVRGADLPNLVGRRGETLSALQYITRLIASRELQRRANIIVDVDGYKSRRADTLRELAKRMADQVIDTGRAMTLEPMPPYERRIIHLTLRDYPEVETKSVGEGSSRKVTIVPK